MSPLRLQRGDCFRETRSPSPSASTSASVFEADEVIGLPCNDPHDFEVYFTADLPEGAFPGQASVVSTTESRCAAAFESFVGVPYDDSTLEIIYFFPSAQTWARAGDRQMTCAATDGSTIGTLADARH